MSTTAAATEPFLDFTNRDFKKMGQRYIVEGKSTNAGYWLAKSTSAKLGEKPIEVSEKELTNRLKGKKRDQRRVPPHHINHAASLL